VIVAGTLAGSAFTLGILIYKNGPTIRAFNDDTLLKYARFATQNLPREGAILLCDSDDPKQVQPWRAYLIQAMLAHEGRSRDYLVADTQSLNWPPYHRYLHETFPKKWPLVVSKKNDNALNQIGLLAMINQLSLSNTVCYLNPSFGYYFEQFYQEPHGLTYRLHPLPTNNLVPPLPSKELIAENESFWSRVIPAAQPDIQRALNPPDYSYPNNIFDWFLMHLHVQPEPNLNAIFAGLYYSRSLNFWGVQLQRAGELDRAVASFASALKLNPENVSAAINGDFYHRDGTYAGAPYGLQVAEGELLSAPSGAPSVWIDAQGQPHLGKISSAFQVVWPDGSTASFRLNGERRWDGLELYTQAVGRSTRTAGGREIILETAGGGTWLPLRAGEVYSARVREIRQAGNTRIEPGTMVLSAGPALAPRLPSLSISNVLRLSTATLPALHGVRAAISGDPILVSNGLAQKGSTARAMGYHQHSMEQRHPRAAVGWNQQYFFLVEVDGRQWDLSVGMSLDELSDYLVRLGCEQAMNFDGGGSATLWFKGEVRNSPCENAEREISNCLAITKRESRSAR